MIHVIDSFNMKRLYKSMYMVQKTSLFQIALSCLVSFQLLKFVAVEHMHVVLYVLTSG